MSTTTIQAEDWITRADMAALMRRSEDTVRRAVKNHNLPTREDEAGRVLVHVADFMRLGLITVSDLTVGATPAESAEVLRARETISALKAQVADLGGRFAEMELNRERLHEQLAVKDKQIAQQSTHIAQLIGRVGPVGGAA